MGAPQHWNRWRGNRRYTGYRVNFSESTKKRQKTSCIVAIWSIFVISAKRAFGESERLYLELSKRLRQEDYPCPESDRFAVTPAEQSEVKKVC